MSVESHEIVVLKPKPSNDKIRQMIAEYFDEEASGYDDFTEQIERRRLYTEGVDRVIADHLKQRSGVARVLSIGAGTGKRELRIRELAGLDFDITCTDVSSNMCKIIEQRGMAAWCGAWENMDVRSREADNSFDAALLLHCYGLIASHEDRLRALSNASLALRHGGVLCVDVLSLDDKDEWGPRIRASFASNDLLRCGYEMGDVIYRRIGKSAISYCHYFTKEEMTGLLESGGLKVSRILNIGYATDHGQVLSDPDRGSLLCLATKP